MIKQPKPNFELQLEILLVKEWSLCNEQDKPPEKVRKKTVVELSDKPLKTNKPQYNVGCSVFRVPSSVVLYY